MKRTLGIINSPPFFFCYFGINAFQQVPHSTRIQYKKKPQDFSRTKLTFPSLFLLIRNHVLMGGGRLVLGSWSFKFYSGCICTRNNIVFPLYNTERLNFTFQILQRTQGPNPTLNVCVWPHIVLRLIIWLTYEYEVTKTSNSEPPTASGNNLWDLQLHGIEWTPVSWPHLTRKEY